MIDEIIRITQYILEKLPLGLFVFLGSFLEEVIAPIPSPFIMSTAGLTAMQRNYSLIALALLVILGAIGKTIASWVVYMVADKAEDIVLGKVGKFFGINHEQIEKFGKIFSKGWYDDVILFLLRAIPILPTFLVSVGCGFIKFNMRTFIVSTFLGTIVRNIFYLSLGYYGSQALNNWQFLIEENLILILGIGITIIVMLLGLFFARKHIASRYLGEET